MLTLAMTRPLEGNAAAPRAVDADLALARAAHGGDREALAALMQRHARAVLELCHHVGGAHDAHDAAQESLERIVRQLAHFDPARGSFRSFALAVSRNVCRDRLRRRVLERAAFAGDGESIVEHASAGTPDAERLAMARETGGRLDAALAELPEPMRSALVLFHVHESSYEEIARALEVPIGTVMTWLHRGRQRLRTALEESR